MRNATVLSILARMPFVDGVETALLLESVDESQWDYSGEKKG